MKALLYLNEDLASSIAIRYADYLCSAADVQLHIIHIEEPDSRQQAGTGWVRRTWESGMQETGAQAVKRIIRTENVKCHFAGPPKIIVGDKEFEVLRELRMGGFDLYMEGHIDTSSTDDFYRIVSSKLYSQAPCPTLMIKNLTVSKTAAIFLANAVDYQRLVTRFQDLFHNSKFDADIIYFKSSEQSELSFMDVSEGGSILKETEKLLKNAGIPVNKTSVLCGTPEQAGDFLRNYAFVAANLPVRKSLRAEVLAHTPTSVLFC